MNAEQFEVAWRRGQRLFHDVTRVEVSPEFVASWEQRTAALRDQCAALLALVEADPHRRGNWLHLRRIDELQAEQWQLALIRDRVQKINARALPPPPGPPVPARRRDAVSECKAPSR